MSGLTPQGFQGKSTVEIRDEIAGELRAAISPSLNVEADSILGHLIGIISDQLALSWDLAQDVYASQYPDTATGASLDQVAAILGVTRLPAMRSVVTIRATGTPGTVLVEGRVISVAGTGERFRTTEDATIGPEGHVDIRCESEETGPVLAPAGTLTEIETPVAGWDEVTNPEPAIPGRNVETDLELRTRLTRMLRAVGSGTVDAIRAGLLEVPLVTSATVFENTHHLPRDGMPPKSFEAVIEGGESQEILEAIWRLKPAGIYAHGETVGTVTDSQGVEHEVRYTRPTLRRVYVSVTLRVGDDWPADGAQRVRESIVSWGQRLQLGEDVVHSRLYGPIYHGAPGIEDVTSLLIGLDPGAMGSANLPIGPREKATFDADDIMIQVEP